MQAQFASRTMICIQNYDLKSQDRVVKCSRFIAVDEDNRQIFDVNFMFDGDDHKLLTVNKNNNGLPEYNQLIYLVYDMYNELDAEFTTYDPVKQSLYWLHSISELKRYEGGLQ